MQVFRTIESIGGFFRKGSAVTIGSFDGVHIGHQAIIGRLAGEASKQGLKSVLVTFDPHPQQILSGPNAPALLTVTDEKLRILEDCNLDAVVVLNFTHELSLVKAAEFLEKYLLQGLSCKKLVIGQNHAFGNRREGNVEFLRANSEKYGYQLVALDPVMAGGVAIRSMRIRKEISGGDYGEALSMLGHDLEFSGTVVRGKGMGKSLGFPTINVKLPAGKIIPPAGVYAAYNLIGSVKRYGMMYVGDDNPEFAFEVNLFDYQGDLYGEKVSVYPTQFIRRSIRFDDNRELVRQIEMDEVKIRSLFKLV